jgi:hypothetical protein
MSKRSQLPTKSPMIGLSWAIPKVALLKVMFDLSFYNKNQK